MPKYRNTTSRDISLLHQGRKISIPPGAIVDGPDHFKMYRGLSIVTESDVDEYNRLLPKIVKQNPHSPFKKFIKNGDSIMNSTNINNLPLNPIGVDSVFQTRRYLNNYPKSNLKVSVYLTGTKEQVKNFIISTSGKLKFKNIDFWWLTEDTDNELKTSSFKEMIDNDNIFKLKHSADLLIIDDYITTFMKYGCINIVNIPRICEITELSSHHVKSLLINSLKPTKTKISILTVTNNQQQYNDLLDDLQNQKTTFSYEIVSIPNYNKEFSSIAEALNIGRDICNGDVVVMCHQDLRVPVGWVEGIANHIKYFEDKHIKWGVLGIAGCYKHSIGGTPDQDICVIYLSDKLSDGRSYAQVFRQMFGPRKEVQTVDELCIIVPKIAPFKFDEQIIDHFHWYGADICLDSLSHGYRNFAIDAECQHLSDGRSNLSGGHAQKFMEDARKIWWKWSHKFNYFRTTTATFMFKEKIIIMGIFILINSGNGNKNLPEIIKMG